MANDNKTVGGQYVNVETKLAVSLLAQGFIPVNVETMEKWARQYLGMTNPTHEDYLGAIEDGNNLGLLYDPDFGGGIVYYMAPTALEQTLSR